jgi:hypothetical protein
MNLIDSISTEVEDDKIRIIVILNIRLKVSLVL